MICQHETAQDDEMAKLDKIEKGYLGVVGGVFLLIITFWAVVAYVAMHFILKFW